MALAIHPLRPGGRRPSFNLDLGFYQFATWQCRLAQEFVSRLKIGPVNLTAPARAMHLRLPLRAEALLRHHMRGCTTFSTAQAKVVIVGIDFGCKNSRVAIIDSLVPQVVDSDSGCSTPSYVTPIPPKDSDGQYAWALQRLEGLGKCVAVGELAKRRMSRQPSDVVFNMKKLIGKQFGDHYVQEMRKRVHFRKSAM